MSRPRVGAAVHIRLDDELLAAVDAQAESEGESRASAIRSLLRLGLHACGYFADKPDSTILVMDFMESETVAHQVFYDAKSGALVGHKFFGLDGVEIAAPANPRYLGWPARFMPAT